MTSGTWPKNLAEAIDALFYCILDIAGLLVPLRTELVCLRSLIFVTLSEFLAGWEIIEPIGAIGPGGVFVADRAFEGVLAAF
jgi:hypothetical protein